MTGGNRLVIDGLDELRAALKRLPAELTNDAAAIVLAHAMAAETSIAAQYAAHDHTGNLSRGLTVAANDGSIRFGVRAVVRSRAPHTYWLEHGTQVRKTRTGANRGALMHPINVFIPTAIRARADMVRALIGLVEAAGFVTSGGVL